MYSVSLSEVMKEFQLEDVTGCTRIDQIRVGTSDVNRPGLQLAGYLGHFGEERIQIVGRVETEYLKELTPSERYNRLDALFQNNFPCIVVARGLDVFPEMIEVAKKFDIPVLKTRDITSRFIGGLIRFLNFQLAARTTYHGVLVEVYGEGILIIGESGVGKSEIALELVRRGHRLVADDVVEIRKVSDKTLVGTSPEIVRHLLEIRGIGILDIKNLYGVGSIKVMEKINLVIKLELWVEGKCYERLGIEEEMIEMLGISVPSLTVPVKPGRNLAVVVEVASMNNRQKKMGYNAAKALSERLFSEMGNSNNECE